MPRRNYCSFCGLDYEPGTGKSLVMVNSTVLYFCSSKCEKNHNLGRIPIKVRWTKKYRKFRAETLGLGKEQAEKMEREAAKVSGAKPEAKAEKKEEKPKEKSERDKKREARKASASDLLAEVAKEEKKEGQ